MTNEGALRVRRSEAGRRQRSYIDEGDLVLAGMFWFQRLHGRWFLRCGLICRIGQELCEIAYSGFPRTPEFLVAS